MSIAHGVIRTRDLYMRVREVVVNNYPAQTSFYHEFYECVRVCARNFEKDPVLIVDISLGCWLFIFMVCALTGAQCLRFRLHI